MLIQPNIHWSGEVSGSKNPGMSWVRRTNKPPIAGMQPLWTLVFFQGSGFSL